MLVKSYSSLTLGCGTHGVDKRWSEQRGAFYGSVYTSRAVILEGKNYIASNCSDFPEQSVAFSLDGEFERRAE